MQVPTSHVLGGVGRGVSVMMSGLDYERLVLAAGPLGLMAAALDVALPYATQRRQFGQPIGEFQVGRSESCMHAHVRLCQSVLELPEKVCSATVSK